MVATVLSKSNSGDHIKFKVIGKQFQSQVGVKYNTLNELVAAQGSQLLYPIPKGAKKPVDPSSISISTPSKSSGLFDTDPTISLKKDAIPSTIPTKAPVKKVEEEYEKALNSGTDATELLKKAFDEGHPAIAAWMVQKGGSLDELELHFLGSVGSPGLLAASGSRGTHLVRDTHTERHIH